MNHLSWPSDNLTVRPAVAVEYTASTAHHYALPLPAGVALLFDLQHYSTALRNGKPYFLNIALLPTTTLVQNLVLLPALVAL